MLEKGEKTDVHSSFIFDTAHFKVQRGSHNELTRHHNHNYLQIWYVLRGSFWHTVNDVEFEQKKGDFFVLPSYVAHQLDARNSADVEWIFIDLAENFLNLFPEGMEKNMVFNLTCLHPLMYSETDISPVIHFDGEDAAQIEKMLLELLKEYSTKTSLTPVYIRSKLVRLLSFVAEHYDADMPASYNMQFSSYRRSIRTAIDYVDSHFTEPLTRQEVCKIAMMSRSSFTYIFKQIIGESFLDYIHILRIRLAKKLLAEGGMNVTEIAEKCGFSSVTYFDRVFKKITGLTPRQYLYITENQD